MNKLSTEYIRAARKAKATQRGGASVKLSAAQRRSVEDIRTGAFSARNADSLRYGLRSEI